MVIDILKLSALKNTHEKQTTKKVISHDKKDINTLLLKVIIFVIFLWIIKHMP